MWYNGGMWRDDRYYYSTKTLKTIAERYTSIYSGLELREGSLITNPFLIAEYKADFDIALGSIGRGKWKGKVDDCSFGYFRHFGRLQQIIIADIFGILDNELAKLCFENIPQLRGYAYFLMKCYLNGIDWDNRRCYDKEK